VATCAGAGGSGSMAADKRYQHLNLNPQAAVAVRVAVSKGSGATAEPSSGLLAAFPLPGAKRSETAGLEKLPFTVCANFALSRAGQRRPTAFQPESTSHESESSASETTDHVKGRFNTSLLTCVGLAAVGLLERLVMRHSQLDCTGLYNMLPTASLPGSLPEVATLAAQLSTLVAKKRMWKLRRGHVAMLVQGCFLQSATSLGGLSTEAGSFLQERLPLFEVPETVMPWLEAWGVQGIRSVSAAVVRTELKALAAANALANTTLFTPSVAAELLLFATSDVAVVPEDAEAESVVDLDALAACKGLPCLDATGAVQFIGSRTWVTPAHLYTFVHHFRFHIGIMSLFSTVCVASLQTVCS